MRKMDNPATRFMRLTDLSISIHSLSLLLFLVITAAANKPHPVHLFPESYFSPNRAADFLSGIFTHMMAISAIAAVIMFILTLQKERTGKLFSIHRGAYVFWALALTWLLWFYQLLIF